MNEFPSDGTQQEERGRDEVEEQLAESADKRGEGPAAESAADEPATSIETESEPEETSVAPEEDKEPSQTPDDGHPELASTPDADSVAPVASAPEQASTDTTPVDSPMSESPTEEDRPAAEQMSAIEEQPPVAAGNDAIQEPEAASPEAEEPADTTAYTESEATAEGETAEATAPVDSSTEEVQNGEEPHAEGEHHGEGEPHRPRIILKAGTDPESIKALELCREKVAQLHLKMHPLAARWDGDKHVTIFFRADEKVDFRKLVRELSRVLRARIELRQLGPREQGKLCGLVGKCGQPLCCQTFLGEFTQSSIKMAKTQDLALNPMKISGVCGRLLCCLNYEQEMYAEVKSRMPKVNKWVETEFGPGRVTALNVLKETVTVQLETATRELPLDQVRISEAPSQS